MTLDLQRKELKNGHEVYVKETELTVDEAPPRRSSTALLSPEDAAAAGVEPGKQPPAGANKVQRGDTILTMT